LNYYFFIYFSKNKFIVAILLFIDRPAPSGVDCLPVKPGIAENCGTYGNRLHFINVITFIKK